MHTVKCPKCKIAVKIKEYGNGYVAICSRCQRVVYNQEHLPKE